VIINLLVVSILFNLVDHVIKLSFLFVLVEIVLVMVHFHFPRLGGVSIIALIVDKAFLDRIVIYFFLFLVSLSPVSIKRNDF